MKQRILLIKRFDHSLGNGTTAHYAPNDIGEFDEPLANSLVYEGYGVAAPADEDASSDELAADEGDQKSQGDAPEDKAIDAAPENKKRR